ncbi:MAG: branched-chain amino acid ABC transporter substrate-binding protein [Alphaproteobacteria bacterium]|nr:branched-chain amino acid ABC transporter substrate-binding protein [Alphaproteobacteria bacterium]
MERIISEAARGAPSRRRILAASLAGAGGALLAPSPIRRARADTTVKIGQIEALTGPSAAYGIRGRDGAQLAIDEINSAGGLGDGKGAKVRLELAPQDMANDPKQAVTIFRQLATDDSVIASVGPTNSVGFVPVVPIAGQVKLPLVGDGSGAPIKEWNAFAYRVNPISGSAVPVMLRKIIGKLGVKRLAVLYDQTQDGQAGDAQVCKSMAGELGYDVVAFEAFRAGDQDFSPQLATIRNAKPDAIYVAGATGDGVRATSQVKEMGFQQPLLTGYGSFQDPVYWDGTKGQIKGDYTWLAQDLSSPSAQLKDFLERYNKRFPQEATSFSTYGYDAIQTVAEAVKRAGGTDRGKVQEALAALEFTTPLGTKVTFKNPPNGDNLTPSVVVIQVTGRGTYVAV